MAVRPIVQDGDPVLDSAAHPVPEELFGTPELLQIVADMADTLDLELDGVALAAPQIGIPYRIFIVRHDRTIPPESGDTAEKQRADASSRAPDVGVFINPEFVRSSRRRVEMDEGCLSVRGIYGTTLRHERATVRARRVDGGKFERGAGDLLAQIFQHEVDHLNGILFVDHAVDLVRVKKPREDQRHGEASVNTATSVPFVFFGTPYVARDTLEILKSHGYIPTLVVTSPDSPRGRGLKLTPSETKVWALENDVPVMTPEKITPEVVEEIMKNGCGVTKPSIHEEHFGNDSAHPVIGVAPLAIVAAYGKILPKTLIDSFPLGILNIHYSLLPKYRGASPVESALLNGDAVTGVAIQQMVPALDAGDLLALAEVQIDPLETTRELRPRLVTIGADLLADILPDFLDGLLVPQPQDNSLATKCKKISKEDGLLNLHDDARKNWNKYRAYAESPGTYFFAQKGGREIRVKIAEATFIDDAFVIERVIPEGKSVQDYSDFLKNHSIS
jgi:methionyl-tRNA formyltransferase